MWIWKMAIFAIAATNSKTDIPIVAVTSKGFTALLEFVLIIMIDLR